MNITLKQIFKINTPHIVSDFIEDEVIILNLKSGNYYSCRFIAAKIWLMLEQGLSIEKISIDISKFYDGKQKDISDSVDDFIKKLINEELIIISPLENKAIPQVELDNLKESKVTIKEKFIPPILEVYNNLQDLLLVDPIHDVSDEGWPNPL
jgi:hypothetical protein